MMRLAAESDGKEGERVAKLPWDTESHRPTPNKPQPPSWNTERLHVNSLTRQLSAKVCVCVCVYPEEQVEEEEHVFDAADATTSHDWINKYCKKQDQTK